MVIRTRREASIHKCQSKAEYLGKRGERTRPHDLDDVKEAHLERLEDRGGYVDCLDFRFSGRGRAGQGPDVPGRCPNIVQLDAY
jgi:hypothetical protein